MKGKKRNKYARIFAAEAKRKRGKRKRDQRMNF
jgi:hypothetical protein